MAAPSEIERLVDAFALDSERYLRADYPESQARNDFITPFFAALGWEMQPQPGVPLDLRDVIVEEKVRARRVADDTQDVSKIVNRHPDYTFRIDGKRRFFVEAKKPSRNLREDSAHAIQVRTYGWNAQLPVSILTDFEELAVYDCRIPPKEGDTAQVALLPDLYLTYDKYIDRWDEIYALFSREAVAAGSLDKYIEQKRVKAGTQTVDKAFLAEISRWRETLAADIHARNPDLPQHLLNYAVQMTINRIIFLRICEDRGIEREERLQVALKEGVGLYPRLVRIFREADHRYNSGLFHFRDEHDGRGAPESFTLEMSVGDEPLARIIEKLYYPNPYKFDVIPIEILGQVYEQFLGKVIRIDNGGVAVEEKPEVRKAGGVYYTPSYIVDYIVAQTVGVLVEGKRPEQIAEMRVLDPACGSGSFLIGAYSYLLDWYLRWYTDPANNPDTLASKRKKRPIERVTLPREEGETEARITYRLTLGERKRILLRHIFGVDIDTQAVEVTKLSLLLKVLEGDIEGEAQQLTLGLEEQERVLPDLGNNIKAGNSLIGPDFYESGQSTFLTEDEERRINVLDWHAAYPEIMKVGGFDAVIGNPPWGGDIDRELEYFHRLYPDTTQEHTDSFKLFVDAGLRLVKASGFLGMIVPNTLLLQRRLKDVRQLLQRFRIVTLIDLGENVFKGVVAPSCVLTVNKAETTPKHTLTFIDVSDKSPSEKELGLDNPASAMKIHQANFSANENMEFRASSRTHNVPFVALGKLPHIRLRDAGINYQRVGSGMQEKGKSDLAVRLLYDGEQQDPRDKMYWKGSDIDRYWSSHGTTRYCRPYYSEFLRANEVVRLNNVVFEMVPKILLRQTADHIIATLDYEGKWFGRSIIALVPSSESDHRIEYYLGLLNSQYFRCLYDDLVQETGRVFAQVKLSKLEQLPIRTINFNEPTDKARHDRMVQLVEQMLDLHKRLAAEKSPYERERLQTRISHTDRQIDTLVYELYALTPEEIAIVEGREA